jgi:hypothetical protein
MGNLEIKQYIARLEYCVRFYMGCFKVKEKEDGSGRLIDCMTGGE